MKWKVKKTVDPNGFYNYAAHILRPQNTERGEPELKILGRNPKIRMSSFFIKLS